MSHAFLKVAKEFSKAFDLSSKKRVTAYLKIGGTDGRKIGPLLLITTY